MNALEFATHKHANQTRRTNGEPYVNHCIRVFNIVSECLPLAMNREEKECVAISALLHDTLEDTNTTFEEIDRCFGKRVAENVLALTNDKNQVVLLGKQEYLAQKINTLSEEQLLIKLADRLDNVSDLRENDSWSRNYANQTFHVFFEVLDKSKLGDRHLVLLNLISERISSIMHA